MPWRLLEAVEDNDGGKVNLKPSTALRGILEPMLAAAGEGSLYIDSDMHNMQNAVDPGLNDMAVSGFVNPKYWSGNFTSETQVSSSDTYYWIHSGFWKRFKDIPAEFFAPWQTDSYYFGMGDPNDTSGSPGTPPYTTYANEYEIEGHPGVMNPPFCWDISGCSCRTNAISYLDQPPTSGAIGGPNYFVHDDGDPNYIPYRQTDSAAWHAFYIAVNEDQNLFAYISVDHATETIAQVDANDGYRLYIQTANLYHSNYDYQYFMDIETDPDPDPEPPSPTPDPNDPFSGDAKDGSDQTGGRDGQPQETEFGSSGFRAPTLDGTATGFFTAYRVGESILEGIAQRLWNPTFWDQLKEQYRSPADMFIALYLLPVTSKTTDNPNDLQHYYNNAEDAEYIRAGHVVFTGAAKGQRVIRRYARFPMGYCTINPRWDAYPDMDQYTKIRIYLPFCGEYELAIGDIITRMKNVGSGDDARCVIDEDHKGSELHLEYVIDTLTGACVALLYINGYLKYQFTGQTAVELPWSWGSSNNAKNQLSSMAGVLGGGAGMILGALTVNPALFGGGLVGLTASTVKGSNLNPMKGLVQGHMNGGIGSLAGAMQDNKPWVTIHRPNIAPAVDQAHYIGQSGHYTNTVGAHPGFNKFVSVHLDGIPCTDAERNEIAAILREGVIV